MVVKKTTKAVPAKKTVQKKTIAKKTTAPVVPVVKKDLEAIVDQQAKQIQKMDAMLTVLDKELKDIKKKVSQDVAVPAAKPVVKAAPKTPIRAKAPAKKVQKAVSKPIAVKTAAKTPVKAKKVVRAPVSAAKKMDSKTFSDDLVEIPADIPNRINDLTSKKKVTQTQLGKDVDLSQKAIHEIASRKVKELNKDKLKKITLALKKYEK